ncbi:CUE domain-containing protein 4, mitochondrial [Parachaetomium inaequale]|uniref:CUE domain-containing protein 4, mitochondrial n=1 Tax=Parachaetomium inaequale TaxID=2588326 RepID=A0AAN6PI78_9PEZI|nr:CUE domain-containing protein 4, mitochondrial [Parachaetomium inaequale]
MADADEAQQQLNLPSLVVILVISGLVIRYLFFSSSPTSGTQSSSSSGRGGRTATGEQAAALARVREAAAERIMQMFPQVDRRAALWDLQRTGGSVAATTERVLAGRLETPPITFQPPPPPGSGTNNTGVQAKPAAAGPAHPDLITRYNLKGKLDAAPAAVNESAEGGSSSGAETGPGKGSGKGWSANRDERQSLLQRRRDQMILEARRKMEAKIAAEKAAGGR